jgi:hypothetical protein
LGLVVAATDDIVGLSQRLSFVLAGAALLAAVFVLMR